MNVIEQTRVLPTGGPLQRARRAAAPLGFAALALIGVACGGEESSSSTTTAASETTAPSDSTAAPVNNSIDVAFAQGMIPHHSQAVEMSELAATNTSNPEVQALATEIIAAQGPEIELMTEWLTSWGAEVPDPEASMDENMEMAGGMMMSGMISDADFEKLRAARDAEFDRLYLELMIQHHEGAIEMAQQELDGGESPEAKALAQQIIDTQQAEITRMEQLLGTAG